MSVIRDKSPRIITAIICVDYAKNQGKSDVTSDIITQVRNRNFICKSAYTLVGLAVSALFLSTLIPKFQYWYTRHTTGKNEFPGVYNLEEEVKKWIPNESYADLEEAQGAIDFFADRVKKGMLPYVLAVELRETGELIGDTGVNEVESHVDEVEIEDGLEVKVVDGDVIEIKEKAKGSQRYKDILEVTGGRLVPAWIEADPENLRGTVKSLPTRDEIDVPVDEMLIVELYSK